MITLKNISVVFNQQSPTERVALRHVNLAIEEGEFITVIGSNGAGKSTFLNVIAGEVLPTKGAIVIDDKKVTKWSTAKRASEVARIFQDPLLGSCADLTVAENMTLAHSRGKKRGLSQALKPDMMHEFQALLKSLNLGLETRLDTYMGSLSGGQRQAISLLMATLSPMKILLLDEHTSALDPKTAASVMKLTQKIVTQKKLTTLMVTHSLHDALAYGTRTVMLHEGKIIYDVNGKARSELTPADLMRQFGVDDDRLLLQV